MTAQVAVFNLEGVAVASESMRTVTQGTYERTWASADKMHDLGPGHRVVALVSGSISFLGLPLPTLLEEWRAGLGPPHPELALYAADFVAWLGQRTDLFDQAAQDADLTRQLTDGYREIRSRVEDALQEADLTGQPWDDLSVQAVVDRTIAEAIEHMTGQADLPRPRADTDTQYLTRRGTIVQDALDGATDGMPLTVNSRKALLDDLPPLLLGKDDPGRLDCDIAFVGYGRDQLLPGHQTITLRGMVNDRVRYTWWDTEAVSRSSPALVAPFGQRDAIRAFSRGYHHRFLTIAHQHLDDLLDQVHGLDPDPDTTDDRQDLARHTHQCLDDDFDRLSRRGLVEPMLDAIEAMPPADLAHVADALIRIQALRATLTRRQPTCGGPIDIALITRHRGVQWIQRKDVKNTR